jgi:hypothetical protein
MLKLLKLLQRRKRKPRYWALHGGGDARAPHRADARGDRHPLLHRGHHRGKAAQVDPIKPQLKLPGTKRLKLKYDEAISKLAFKFKLRRYIEERMHQLQDKKRLVFEGCMDGNQASLVGRCRLNLSSQS